MKRLSVLVLVILTCISNASAADSIEYLFSADSFFSSLSVSGGSDDFQQTENFSQTLPGWGWDDQSNGIRVTSNVAILNNQNSAILSSTSPLPNAQAFGNAEAHSSGGGTLSAPTASFSISNGVTSGVNIGSSCGAPTGPGCPVGIDLDTQNSTGPTLDLISRQSPTPEVNIDLSIYTRTRVSSSDKVSLIGGSAFLQGSFLVERLGKQTSGINQAFGSFQRSVSTSITESAPVYTAGQGNEGNVTFSKMTINGAGDISASYSKTPNSGRDSHTGIDTDAFDFDTPGDVYQMWDIGYSGSLVDSTLTHLIFDFDDFGFTASEKNSLDIYHFIDSEWLALGGVTDLNENNISVYTPSFSPFVLGVKRQGSAPVPGMILLFPSGIIMLLAALRGRKRQPIP